MWALIGTAAKSLKERRGEMKVFDYEDMPNEDLKAWLGHILDDLKKQRGKTFGNVQALKEGAIITALKRVDELNATRADVGSAESSLA